MAQPVISICMATYNGEQFLRQQLDSIVAQSNQDWQLLVRDDSSNDETVRIVEEYAEIGRAHV
jgi:glycosyltransferase involved in cell wall biosynthesis